MDAPESPSSYRVVYSDAVKRLFLELFEVAAARGDGPAFTAALKKFVQMLRLYPQFGDPLIDLTGEPGVIHHGIIPPIRMRYGLYVERRLVLCGTLPALLPMARPDASKGG